MFTRDCLSPNLLPPTYGTCSQSLVHVWSQFEFWSSSLCLGYLECDQLKSWFSIDITMHWAGEEAVWVLLNFSVFRIFVEYNQSNHDHPIHCPGVEAVWVLVRGSDLLQPRTLWSRLQPRLHHHLPLPRGICFRIWQMYLCLCLFGLKGISHQTIYFASNLTPPHHLPLTRGIW